MLVPVALFLVIAQLSSAQSISTDQIESVYRVVLADARCGGRGLPGSPRTVPVIFRELVNPAGESWWTDRSRKLLPSPLVDRVWIS